MRIIQVLSNKKAYLSLLLQADEQEDMIDRYLERGDMYVMLQAGNTLASIVVADEGDGVLEIKNLSVAPSFQRRGYGRVMIEFAAKHYADQYHTLQVGTGDSPMTIPFYERCGFVRSHVVKDFFTDHYDHPIIEGGVLLRDMVYFRKPLG
ncbi:MAG: GNAT family N-acetyltransferase [Clostridia bacterium]|nr:GNAT family N-acetyltransferase [Clostridia bacterium]